VPSRQFIGSERFAQTSSFAASGRFTLAHPSTPLPGTTPPSTPIGPPSSAVFSPSREFAVVVVIRNHRACSLIAIGTGVGAFAVGVLILPIVSRCCLYDEQNYLKMDV
jgi:hypothetical protein